MKTLALHEMGEVIRRVRKERGLRLEDLADENISPATVSNIERGVAHVSPEKITYLLKKLDLQPSKLPEMLVKKQMELKKVQFIILTSATLRQIGQVDEALHRLEELKLEDNHPYISHAYFYKGKCYMSKKKWKQAERAFYNALRSSQQTPYKENNMEAASYLLLAICATIQNDLERALDMINQGLDAYVKTGEMPYIKHLLYKHKALLLERLGRYTEGMQLVQNCWPMLKEFDDIETLLSFYWLRAELSRRTGLLEEGIEVAIEGINIARRNRQYASMYDLWTVLGSIYTELKNWEFAEHSFMIAKKLEALIPADKRLITVHNRTGILYRKQNKITEAFESFQQAIRYAEKFQDFPQLVKNLTLIGELSYQTGETEKAIEYYQQAIKLAQKYQYKKQECRLWYLLACCYDGKNEEKFQSCLRKNYELRRQLQGNALAMR